MQVSYVDTTHCQLQQFDQKHLDTYRNQHEFEYETIRPKGSGLSFLLLYLIAEFLESLGKVRVGHISLYDVLFYGLAIFAAVMIVMQFFKINISGVLLKNPGTIISHQSFSENVHELDFDDLIKDAVKAANYRLATRLYYLKALKKLSDNGLINWQKNKTNFEYYYELKEPGQRKDFYQLTRIFESVWYGNADITAAEFDENLKAFTGFLQNMRG
jgi:hypothetical protein